MTVQQVLDQLRSTPLRLRELAAGVAPEVLRTAPGPDEWSANDVLAHLRACSDRWGEAATRIVEEDSPRIRGTEPRVWITKTNYLDLQFAPSLRAFVRQRTALLRRPRVRTARRLAADGDVGRCRETRVPNSPYLRRTPRAPRALTHQASLPNTRYVGRCCTVDDASEPPEPFGRHGFSEPAGLGGHA